MSKEKDDKTDLSSMSKEVHILISWSIVSDHWSKGCKINGAGSIFREPALQ